MRPQIAGGIPELLIPPCEPLKIPELRIKQNSGAIRMESVYSDIILSGISNFTLRNCKVDMDGKRIVVDFWFPSLHMTANYNLHGKVKLKTTRHFLIPTPPPFPPIFTLFLVRAGWMHAFVAFRFC